MIVLGLGELRQWLGVEVGQAHDELLEDLEARVVDQVERLCSVKLGTADDITEYHSGTGADTIWLDYPANSVETVWIRDGVGFAWVEFDESYYEADGRKLFALAGAGWAAGARNVKVKYEAGYDDPADVPADLKQLILDLCKLMYRDGRVLSSTDLPLETWQRQPMVLETLGRYRRPLL